MPTAPTPPTGRLLTTAVWPGESALVVSPEAAAAPAESVVVTAGIDTMAFSVVDDSTLAVAIPDSMFSADLGVTVHTAGGFVDVGTVHVYGYVGAVEYQGYSGYPIAFPNADAAPTVLVFDTTGAATVNVETGYARHFPSPGPMTCSISTGFAPTYRSDSGWVSLCTGSYLISPAARDSGLFVGGGRIVSQIGPHALLASMKYWAQSASLADDGTVTTLVNFGVNGPLAVVISPRGDRAVMTAGVMFGDTRATTGPSTPVFSSDGQIAFRATGGAEYGDAAAAFSPSGDTLYFAHNGLGVDAYDATDGHLLDSVSAVDGSWGLYVDPRFDLLYALGGTVYGYATSLAIVRRESMKTVATIRVDPACWGGRGGVLVSAPGHHALYYVSTVAAPWWDGDRMGALDACKFDVP